MIPQARARAGVLEFRRPVGYLSGNPPFDPAEAVMPPHRLSPAASHSIGPTGRPAVDPGRRAALRWLGLGLAAAGLHAAGIRPAAAATADARSLVLHNTHTLETLRVEYCRAGAYCERGLAAIARALRDHRTGDVHPIDPGVLDILHEAAVRADREPEFEVISAYRSPRTNANLNAQSSGVARRSLHLEGRAIDVRLVGCDLAKLRDHALALGRGGVGYYPGSRFVHVDTGRFRTWAG